MSDGKLAVDPRKYLGPAEQLVPLMVPKAICDGPPLQPVPTPLQFLSIAQMVIYLPDDSWTVGSCFYVGRRRFVTAGHCLYFHERGQMADRVGIVPPSGIPTVSQVFGVPPQFSQRAYALDNDYGFVDVTDNNWPEPDSHFNLWVAADDQLKEKDTFHVTGYPAPYPGLMKMTTGSISNREVTPHASSIDYTMDTLKGMSGSPLFTIAVDGTWWARGVHVYGECPNLAVRITQTAWNWLWTASHNA